MLAQDLDRGGDFFGGLTTLGQCHEKIPHLLLWKLAGYERGHDVRHRLRVQRPIKPHAAHDPLGMIGLDEQTVDGNTRGRG